jgi:hypothetical protein
MAALFRGFHRWLLHTADELNYGLDMLAVLARVEAHTQAIVGIDIDRCPSLFLGAGTIRNSWPRVARSLGEDR